MKLLGGNRGVGNQQPRCVRPPYGEALQKLPANERAADIAPTIAESFQADGATTLKAIADGLNKQRHSDGTWLR